MTDKIHVAYLFADSEREWNCSHWRCHLLSNAINYRNDKEPERFPHTAKMFDLKTALDLDHPAVQERLGKADILIFQRNVIFQPVWDAMDYWTALGKIVLVDLDDHYPKIPPSNPAYRYWIANHGNLEPEPVEALRIGLSKAHGLISPSHVILKDWEDVVKGYYWPNYPALKDYEGLKRRPMFAPDLIFKHEQGDRANELVSEIRPDSEGSIIIGWGGSISHVDSFYYSGVIEAMQRLMEEDERVVMKFCGSETRMDFLLDKLPRVWKQEGVSPYEWPQVVSTFDIGIAPLDMRVVEDGTGAGNDGYSYDERRSWLKAVEYACAGVPFVATESATYEELSRYGKMVDNRPGVDAATNWYEALKSRVDGLAHFRKEAEDRRGNMLKRYTQEVNADRLVDLYIQIGEEAQSKQGLRLPGVEYIQPTANENIELPAPRTGDPLLTGKAHWADIAHEFAETWHKGLDLWYEGVDIGEVAEYDMLNRVNGLYRTEQSDG